MADYLSCQDPEKVRMTFLVHGDYDTQVTYKSYLETRGIGNIEIPSFGKSYTL